MITRGRYVRKPRIIGGSRKVFFFSSSKSLKILMVSDETILKAFRSHKTTNKTDYSLSFHYFTKTILSLYITVTVIKN